MPAYQDGTHTGEALAPVFPAILVLIPVVTPHGSGPLPATPIGVSHGRNLTDARSLATLPGLRILRREATAAGAGACWRLGLRTVRAGLMVACAGLWRSLAIIGG